MTPLLEFEECDLGDHMHQILLKLPLFDVPRYRYADLKGWIIFLALDHVSKSERLFWLDFY